MLEWSFELPAKGARLMLLSEDGLMGKRIVGMISLFFFLSCLSGRLIFFFSFWERREGNTDKDGWGRFRRSCYNWNDISVDDP